MIALGCDHAGVQLKGAIAEHLASQWRARKIGLHCENVKVWPY